jgi:hypothetical protein
LDGPGEISFIGDSYPALGVSFIAMRQRRGATGDVDGRSLRS